MSHTAHYKKLDTGEVEFTVEVTSDIFDGYRSHALEHMGRDLEVPGFRKGKAPESVLEKNVPEMAILEEMANHAIMDVYPKLLKEHDVKAIGSPAVQLTKIARGSTLGFTLRTSVMPEVTLPDYKAIAKKESKIEKIEVTDEEMTKAIDEIRTMRAGDVKPEATDASETPAAVVGETAPEGVEGKAPEVKPELPELTDEFVKTLGPNIENVEDFKKKLRENIELEKKNRAHESNRLNIMEKILGETTMTIPALLVNAELDRMLYRMKMDIQGMGMSYDAYMQHLGKSEEAMRDELKTDAEKRVKMELLISEIAEKEGLKPDATEMAKQIDEILAMYPGADKERAEAYVEQVLVNEAVFKLLEGNVESK
jgi:trigger factor